MELTALSNLMVALIILLAAAAVYLGFQMKAMQASINKLAYQLYFEVTRKSDLIPQFVENLSRFYARDGFAELIEARAASMKINDFGPDKKKKEDYLWIVFENLLNSALENPEVKKDLVITALMKDLHDAEEKVENAERAYNVLVGKYNRLAKNILLKPVSIMVRAGKFDTY